MVFRIMVRNGSELGGLPFRPVAPEQTCRASSMRIDPGDVDCERRCQATAAPVMPEPMMTVSAESGRLGLLR